MAFRDLMLTLVRRWYIVVVALLVAAAGTVFLAESGGVFTTRTAITFMYPDASALDRYNGEGDKSVISFVAAVAQEINQGERPKTYASADAPYYGAGVREGVRVGLPNEGSQWIAIFRKAEIDIEIVGPTYGWVESTQRQLVDDVQRITASWQSQVGIAAKDRITPTVVPLTMHIYRVAPNRTAQILASAGMLAAALLVGGWGAAIFDRARMRRRIRREQPRSIPSRALKGSIA